jgi:hypothetical protein
MVNDDEPDFYGKEFRKQLVFDAMAAALGTAAIIGLGLLLVNIWRWYGQAA